MSRSTLLAVTICFSFICSNLFAATALAVDNVSPLNENKLAWTVRYGKQEGHGNKRQDLAILFKMRDDGVGKFKGTLLRFDKALSNKYFRANGDDGKVTITGTYTTPGQGNAVRKPVRITGAGSYVTENGKIKVVVVKGTYHPGNDPSVRSDDRMTLHISIKDVKVQGKADVNGAAETENTRAGSDENTEFIAVFQAQEPCEEEPDTDVLAEETMPVADDQIDELLEMPIDAP